MAANLVETLAYALRRLATRLTKADAVHLTGQAGGNLEPVQRSLRALADDLQGRGRSLGMMLPFAIRDIQGTADPLTGMVVVHEGILLVYVDGYGRPLDTGPGYVMALEMNTGVVQAAVWGNVNSPSPTAVVDLAGVRTAHAFPVRYWRYLDPEQVEMQLVDGQPVFYMKGYWSCACADDRVHTAALTVCPVCGQSAGGPVTVQEVVEALEARDGTKKEG